MAEPDTAWRARNISRLLFSASARFQRVKLQAVNADGGTRLVEAQSFLLQNLDLEGTRLTRIAARAMLPKQSMGECVDRAELAGLVERRPDPQDGRAKIVAFTPEGLRVLERLREAVAEAERRMAQVIGQPFLSLVKARLSDYVAAARLTAVAAADLTPAAHGERDGWRRANAGRLMSLSQRLILRDTLQLVREGGAEISEVQLVLFRSIDLGGTRLTDIAARAGVTKQAMAEIVDRAVACDLVDRRPDPADGRAKIVSLTREGRRTLDLIGRGVAYAEQRLARATDAAFVEDLRAALRAYAETDDDEAGTGAERRAQDLVNA